VGAGDLAERVESGAVPWGRMLFDALSVLTAAEVEQARRMYDAEVLQTDAAVSQLVAVLKELGYWDRAVLAFASDHGESLGEHDYWFGHGEYLYDTTLHVPVMLRAAGQIPPGTRIEGVVRLEDVAPTVLALSGAPVPPGLDGVDLAPLLRRGGTVASPRPTAVHLTDHLLVRNENPRRPVAGREGRWWALRDGTQKLIRIPSGPNSWDEELYDLAADPDESVNLAGTRTAETVRLRQLLRVLSIDLVKNAPTEDGAGTHPDPDRLRSLGYAR
jgi:arylsulfatase A-like enzyme